MLTGGASAVAWYATDIDRSVTRITAERRRHGGLVRLAEKSAEITATAPALSRAATKRSGPRNRRGSSEAE
jgi:hypothetical protein